jgi:hypothetical protein
MTTLSLASAALSLLAAQDHSPDRKWDQKWGYEACDKKAIDYPYKDDPHVKQEGFPVGSCPPPADLKLECRDGSKLKVIDAQASTFETGYYHPPEYAVDAHLASRWSSKYSEDQWLLLDLGSEQSFARIYLVWELAHASQYEILTSNDKKRWKTLYAEKNGDGFVDVVDKKGRARFIKIQGKKRAKVEGEDLYGYSLFDVTICGKI